jgi:predicted nucleic acid-binding protein
LVRRGASAGLRRLDALRASLDYLPLTDEALTRASDLWASVRRRGLPTASPDALDADCILAAQALCLPDGVGRVAVLSSNVAHLSRFEGLETASLDDALGMETP